MVILSLVPYFYPEKARDGLGVFQQTEGKSEAGIPSNLEFTILVDKSSMIKRESVIVELL